MNIKNGHHASGEEKAKKCHLGPVINLEEHVQPDWWKNIFNSLYLKTDGDIVEDLNITKAEMDYFIQELGFKKDEVILDLCCGQGRHLLELARNGFKSLSGLDRSHFLIRTAKKRAKDLGFNVKFKEGDARKLPYETDNFDVVTLLGNSFGYFETAQDDFNVLKEIFRVLKPMGRIVIDISNGQFLRENFEPRSWEWMDNKHFVNRERSLSTDKQKLISREVISNVEKGVISDQFYSVRLYSYDEINKLLKQVGFSDIKMHQEIISHTQRNQDLGMMQQRFIISAVVKKDWTVQKKQKTKITTAVLFGDPHKPDEIKPSSVFDEDDFYTINELKKALNTSKDYRFIYIDKHERLIKTLLEMKQKGVVDYVFNLCDEGYNNDPKKELHVPALMEMLDIPFTGSNPQTLAYCYDKSLIRGVAKEMGLKVPKAIFVKPEDNLFELPFDFPAIVKPNFGDSSFGITQKSVVSNIEELIESISEIRDKVGYNNPIIVEEFLTGKDITVGIIGNPPESYKVLPILEEDYSELPAHLPKICGYEAKWMPDSPYWTCIKSKPANLSENVESKLIQDCLKLSERLDVRDYSRMDWRLDSCGVPRLLEVNPNPGWCWDGHLAKMAALDGVSYAEMIHYILRAAEKRIGFQR